MKKYILTAAAMSILLTAGTAVGPASANRTPGCVTAKEFAKARNGMTKPQVAGAFGTKGKRSAFARAGGYTSEVRSYKTCTRFGAVAISFSNGRLAAKSGVF